MESIVRKYRCFDRLGIVEEDLMTIAAVEGRLELMPFVISHRHLTFIYLRWKPAENSHLQSSGLIRRVAAAVISNQSQPSCFGYRGSTVTISAHNNVFSRRAPTFINIGSCLFLDQRPQTDLA